MQRITIVALASIASLIIPKMAHAQLAVIDSANLAQNIQTAAQAVLAVKQLEAQLSQLQQTYQMFTNPTNILNMTTGLENQALENPMPAANSLAGVVGGQAAQSGPATTFYEQNHIYSPTDGTVQSNQINSNAQSIANIEGVASTNLDAIEQRLQQLPDLEADLNAASSITQVNAINGRIAAESQFVQAQQAQAANLQVLASAQAASQAQQAEEAHQQSDDDALAALNVAAQQQN
jgi:Type IV secretion system proteins